MKDGKYEVGDVIAFRVTGEIGQQPLGQQLLSGPVRASDEGLHICCNLSMWGYPLERIPNPQLMDGEWWKGWRWGKINRDDPEYDRAISWYGGGSLMRAKDVPGLGPINAIIPPKHEPCPELRGKIEKLEAELAELKKQALG